MSEPILVYERLEEIHRVQIETFDCGKELVNNFLKEEAQKLQDLRKVITHLSFDENQNLVGYFSLFNESVTIVKSKREEQQWDDITNEKSVFPAVRLHFLGFQQHLQKRGIGEQLLFEVIGMVKELSNYSGCNFITLETEDDRFNFYKKRFFQYLRKSEHDNNFIDMCLRYDWYY